MLKRRASVALVLVSICLTIHVAPTGARSQTTITIGGHSYLQVNVKRALRFIKSPSVQMFTRLLDACPNDVEAYGFVSKNSIAGAVVAWIPASVAGCLDTSVSGGGPGGGSVWQPCAQFFRTSNRSFFVLIVASNATACADASTQVPSGPEVFNNRPIAASTTAPALPLNTPLRLKCQDYWGGRLVDYVAPVANKLPVSKDAWFLWAENVTNGEARLVGVPKCSGIGT